MKKIILLVLSIIAFQISKAQGPSWLWAKSSSGGSYEYANGISVDTAGHFFVGFRANGTINFNGQSATGTGANNPFVGGFDTSGTCNWLQEYTYSGGEDYPWGFCRDKNDNVYSGGVVNSGGFSPMFVEKYDKNGNLKWHVTVTGGGLAADGLAADGAGCVYVVGAFQNAYGTLTFGTTTLTYGGSNQAIFIAKMDSNGNWLWAKMADGTGANDGYDVARGIAIDQFANIYVTGGYYNMPTFGSITVPNQSGNSYPSLYVAEYDSSGNALNVTTATNAGFNNGDCCTTSKITVDSCGYFYVTGYFQGTAQFGGFSLPSQGGQDAYVAKCSNSGVWQWVNDIGSSGGDVGQAIALDKTSDVYVGGNYSNNSATLSGSGNWGDSTISGGDIFIAKYANSTGALQWVKSLNANGGMGGLSVDNQNYMYVTSSYSGSVTLGSTTLNATSNSNVFIAKLDTVGPRTIIPVVKSSYCPGSTDTIFYTIKGTFNPGNTFTAQLSDSTGSFVNDTSIGSVNSTTSGYIIITIPANTPVGSNYLIRVISSNPAGSSWANGCGAYFSNNVYPNDFYVSIGGSGVITASISPLDTSVCSGAPVNLTAFGGTSYLWSNGDTGSFITIHPITDSVITLTATSGCGSGMVTDTVKVSQSPPLTILPSSPTICTGQGIALTVPASGSGYTWGPSMGLNATTGDTVIASPTITTTYVVSGNTAQGCATTGSDSVVVQAPQPLIILPQPPPTFCSGLSAELKVSGGGTNFVWSPSSSLSSSTGDSVNAFPIVSTTYTVTGNDSLGCASSGTESVNVIQSPNTPTFYQHGDTLTSSSKYDNQWYMNGNLLNNDTSQNLIITNTSPDQYWVIVANEANGCSSSSDTLVTSGIQQLASISNQLSIYPNPFNSNIFIQINSSAKDVKDWNLQITDVLGRIVYSQSSLNYSNDIDLSNLSSGVYFITVINKTGRAVFPVVRQN